MTTFQLNDNTGGITIFLSTVIIFSLFSSFVWNKKKTKEQDNPYTFLNHPDKTFLDKLLGLIMIKNFPIGSIAKYTCKVAANSTSSKAEIVTNSEKKEDDEDQDEDSVAMQETLNKFRKLFINSEKGAHVSQCKAWNKLLQQKSDNNDYLVGGTVLVPRNSNILSDWNIVDYKEESNNNNKTNEGNVEIEFVCPVSSINGKYKLEDNNENNAESSKGYKVISTCNLEDLELSSQADIFIHFHGGGMIVGDARDGLGVGYVQNLVQMKCDAQEKENRKSESDLKSLCPPVIFLSVTYSLAPEHPFPSPIIDGLSVSSFIFEQCQNPNIHFCGCSAGGNLSAVVGLETFRYYTDSKRIKSLVSIDPMLLPQTKTKSYHMNSNNSPMCPVEFVRWSWAAYLGLRCSHDSSKHGSSSKCSNSGKIDFYSLEDYNKALNNSKWFLKNKEGEETTNDLSSSNFNRLISPQVDLPPNLNSEDAPTIIVKTSKADPLRDDGIDFVQKLKQIVNGEEEGSTLPTTSNILHFEARGSHIVSIIFDKEAREKLNKAWYDAFWAE